MYVLPQRPMPSMRSNLSKRRFGHPLLHRPCHAIRCGFDYAAFHDDVRTVYAVTRCLEIISEASRRLPDDLKARHPSIAWKRMAGAGNVYRHDYEDVAAHYLWDTLQRDLRELRVVIEQELSRR